MLRDVTFQSVILRAVVDHLLLMDSFVVGVTIV